MQNLVERIEFHPQLLSEAVGPDNKPTGRMIVQGVFQRADEKNKNGRIYPSTLWEKVLSQNSEFQKRLGSGGVAGQLEHPESGTTTLPNISHKIIEVRREGKDICGKALILNTPGGQILKELFEAKIPVGISSRGRGETQKNDDAEIVEDSYSLDTFDFVYDPSVEEARPKPVRESAAPVKQEKNVMDKAKAARRLGEASETINTISGRMSSVKSPKDIVGIVESLRAVGSSVAEIDDADVASDVGRLMGRIDGIQKEAFAKMAGLAEDKPEDRPEGAAMKAGKGLNLGKEDPAKKEFDTTDESKAKSGKPGKPGTNEMNYNMGDEGEAAEEPPAEEEEEGKKKKKHEEEEEAAAESVLRKKLETAIGVIEELRDRYLGLEKKKNESDRKLEAALALTDSVVKEHQKSKVAVEAERLVAANPRLKPIADRLRECRSTKHLKVMVESLVNPLLGQSKPASRDGALPPLRSASDRGKAVAESTDAGQKPEPKTETVVPSMLRNNNGRS
jgi:hypothetical protein